MKKSLGYLISIIISVTLIIYPNIVHIGSPGIVDGCIRGVFIIFTLYLLSKYIEIYYSN